MILRVGERPIGYGSVWHMEKCPLGDGCVWVVGHCIAPPFAWVGGMCAPCSAAGCVGCLLSKERHSADSGCVFFLVQWEFVMPSVCPCFCAWFWFCRRSAIFHVLSLIGWSTDLSFRPVCCFCAVCVFSGTVGVVLHLFCSSIALVSLLIPTTFGHHFILVMSDFHAE